MFGTRMPVPSLIALLAMAQSAPALAAEDRELLEQAGILVDPDLPAEERIAAGDVLSQASVERALPFLRAALEARDGSVKAGLVGVLGRVPSAAVLGLLTRVARDVASSQGVRVAAVEALGAHAELEVPQAVHAQAGDLVWELASDRDQPAAVRARAQEVLRQRYPATLAEKGRPVQPTGTTGVVIGAVGNGVAGGVLLGSVGVFGQLDSGPAIGAVGGSLIGLGTAALYATQVPVTDGQGLAYASGVGWGVTVGGFAASALTDRPDRAFPRADPWDVRATMLVLGTAGGTAVGAYGLRQDPMPSDVLEIDLAGYLGSQLAVAGLRLANEAPSTGDWSAVALTGAAAGLTAGVLLHPTWELEPSDALFAASLTAQTTTLGILAPNAFDIRRSGWPHTGIHVGLAGGLLLAELIPAEPRRSGLMLYGTMVGNGLGAGVPLLFEGDDIQPLAATMMVVGTAGTVTGYALGDTLDPDAGDAAMIGVGTGLVAAEAVALSSVLAEYDRITAEQAAGISLTSASLAGAGFLAATPFVSPHPADMALLGSSAAWGIWYGAMIPYAADLDLSPPDHVLVATFTADGFVLAGGALLLAGVEPVDTLGAQLGGVAGATTFALAAGLGTDDGSTVALASVVGSGVGMGAGAVVQHLVKRRRASKDASARLELPRLDLPGSWSPTAGPMVMEDGSAGIRIGVDVVGW